MANATNSSIRLFRATVEIENSNPKNGFESETKSGPNKQTKRVEYEVGVQPVTKENSTQLTQSVNCMRFVPQTEQINVCSKWSQQPNAVARSRIKLQPDNEELRVCI